MTWQSSSYQGDNPRSTSHRHPTSGRETRVGPSSAPMPSHRLSMPNRETQPHRQGPSPYRSYPHPPHAPHHRTPFIGQPSHPPPPPPSMPYDRYYDYQSTYPPTLHHYGSPGQYGEISPDHRALPPSDPYSSSDLFRTGGCTCKKSRCLKLYCQCFALSTTCGAKCKCQTCYNTSIHAESIEEARRTILERNPSAFDDKFRGMPSTPSPYRVPPPPIHVYHHPSPPSPSWPPPYSTPSGPAPPVTRPPSSDESPPPPPRVNKFGCKCRRSFCLKKYCECYQNSVKCGLNCRCTNCRNYPHDGSGLPPPRPPPPVVPVSYGPSSPRCVSEDTRVTETYVTPSDQEAPSHPDNADRMAIMAAVAMTELFGTKETREEVQISTTEVSSSPEDNPECLRKLNDDEGKRKSEVISVVSSPEKSEDEESTSPPKRMRPDISSANNSSPPPESRNPSPVSVVSPSTTYPRHFIQRPPPHHHLAPHYHHRPYHQPPVNTTPHHSRYDPRRQFPSYYPSPPQPRASSYEDVIKSSGLPKALSFRKICSKCGKTRGEHGELGFGNKCVFQDCGKCGAGVQVHTKAGSPMGILCRLTVEEGATPGAAATYERKIRELAARAELQKTLLEDKRERVERLAAQQPFVSTA